MGAACGAGSRISSIFHECGTSPFGASLSSRRSRTGGGAPRDYRRSRSSRKRSSCPLSFPCIRQLYPVRYAYAYSTRRKALLRENKLRLLNVRPYLMGYTLWDRPEEYSIRLKGGLTQAPFQPLYGYAVVRLDSSYMIHMPQQMNRRA